MKTVYEGVLLSVQYTKKDVKKAVIEGMKLGNSVESILRGLCTQDSFPQSYGVKDNKDDADISYNDYLEVEFFNNSGVDYVNIACTMTEIYTVDDDGEFCCGSDYDYLDCLEQKDIDGILEKLEINNGGVIC